MMETPSYRKDVLGQQVFIELGVQILSFRFCSLAEENHDYFVSV